MFRAYRTRAVTILAIFGTCALLSWHVLADRSLDRILERGFIRIGYAVEAPYAFLSPTGAVTGESPELAKYVVRQLGIPDIRWVQTEFGSLVSSLALNRFDVIAAGMFITPERAERVRFSTPTFRVTEGLLVAKGNPLGLHSYDKIRELTTGMVAVLGGAVEESLLWDAGVPSSRLLIVPDALTGRVAVESGEAVALALTEPTIRWMARQDQLGKTEIAEAFKQPRAVASGQVGLGGFAFRQQDTQLIEA